MSALQEKTHGESASVHPAARWFFRLRDKEHPPLGPEEIEEWERFAAEPAHRRELVELENLWQAAHKLGGLTMPTNAELDADDFDGSVPVSEWMARRAAQDRARTMAVGRPIKWLLLAASLTAVLIGTATYRLSWTSGGPREQMQAFATPLAEQRAVNLADGSVVTLGARTEIHARITAEERVIVLDRGEAWFKVAHDETRPFRVYAGRGVITAVGTEFNVRRDFADDIDRVTVTVGSGAVKVEPRSRVEPRSASQPEAEPEWQTAKLEKGQELTYDGEGERGEVRRADVEAAAAWKEGRLEYIHQPLKAVVASVNRYSEKPIVLSDDSIGQLDFSGTVFEGQVNEWLRALQSAFPISVTETEDRILIHTRD